MGKIVSKIERIVIVGGGYAGMLAAVRVARKTRGKAEVELVNGSDTFTERVRLHQATSGQALKTWSIAELLAPSGARFRQGWVRTIDVKRRELRVDARTVVWDRLILAPGSHTDVDRVPGVRAHAGSLDGGSAGKLTEALPRLAACGASVAVVGGGLTGIEAAAELAERYPSLQMTLYAGSGLEPALSAAARAHVRRALRRLGVTLVEGEQVRLVTADAIETDRGARFVAACVWAGGFRASPLAGAAGLALNERGQALVDGSLRAIGRPDIYVAGDAAALTEATVGPVGMSCKHGMPMGAHAADNVAREVRGEVPEPFRFGDTGICISLGRRDGCVDVRRRDGRPRFAVTGHFAARVKEQICRYVVWSIRMESRGLWSYRWTSPVARALPETRANRRLAA